MSSPPRRAWIAPAVLALGWVLLARTAWGLRHAIPPPSAVLAVARRELLTRGLWADVGASLARLGLGVASAALVGAALGFALGRSERVWRAAEPTVDFLRSVPPILTYPVFLLALGYGEAARVAAVFFGSSGIVTVAVAAALAQTPQARADTVRLAGLRGLGAFRALYFYEALPALITGVRLAITSGFIVVVVSEMLVGARYGLGARAQVALVDYRTETLWLVIALAGGINVALSSALRALERRAVHWTGR